VDEERAALEGTTNSLATVGAGLRPALSAVAGSILKREGQSERNYAHNRESVQGNEDEWLRHILREHFHLTNSPRARRLLESALPLPLVRLQPVHLPCTIAETWAPFLQRREAPESPAANEQLRVTNALPLEAIGQTGESAC
jgi:hypothetical protein